MTKNKYLCGVKNSGDEVNIGNDFPSRFTIQSQTFIDP